MYAPAWGYGGPVRLMFDYARWLKRDFRVAAFTGDIHHDFTRIPLRAETINEVSVYRHKVFFPKLAKKSVYLHSPVMYVQAARHIRSTGGPAIVHFSELRGLVPLYALFLKLLFKRDVTLVHSAFGSLHYKRSILRWIYDALFMKAFVKFVDLRLVQNDHENETYRRICSDYGAKNRREIHLLPLHLDEGGTDRARFTESGKDQPAVREVRRTYGILEDALVFLFLGRLHPAKGILRMIDAYLEFSRSYPRKSLLVIVGRDDGFQAEAEEYVLRNRVEGRVRIVNNVYETRFDYYFMADVFLGFPTIFEETMLASIEAMACGTPIVVSREADIPFVEEELAGKVIDFNLQAAVEAMSEITQNLTSFQVNARRVVATHFSGTAASKKLKALFHDAMSRNLSPKDDASQGIELEWLGENSRAERTSSMAAGE
jgi:glycosyltransferase involved in cell wall biosynthesis